MSTKEEEDLAFWKEMAEQTRVFKTNTVAYIPALNPKKTFEAEDIEGITTADVVPLAPFSPKDIQITHYVHMYEFKGWYDDAKAFPQFEGLIGSETRKPKANEAEYCRRRYKTETNEFKIRWRPWFTHKAIYLFPNPNLADGDDNIAIVVYWKKDKYWKRFNPVSPNFRRRHNLKIVIKPPFRKNIWETMGWAQQVAERLEHFLSDRRFHFKGLRLSKVELPLDWHPIEKLDKDNLERPLCRKHAGAMGEFDPEEKGNTGTRYDGKIRLKRKKPISKSLKKRLSKLRRQNKCYIKSGCWHWEPEFYRDALSSMGVNRITLPGLLLLLLSIYTTNSFEYIDLNYIIRSPEAKPHLLAIWDIYLRFGIVACKEYVRMPKPFGLGNAKNCHRYFNEVEPLDTYWRTEHAKVIAEGIQKLIDSGIVVPDEISPDSILKRLSEHSTQEDLKKFLEKLVGKKKTEKKAKKKRMLVR